MVYLAIQFTTLLLLLAAYMQGWLQDFVIYDSTGVGQTITALAALGSVCVYRLWQNPTEVDRNEVARICGWCARLGLLGTLIGVYIAVRQVHGTTSAAEMQGLIAGFTEGIGIAVKTSVVGIFAVLFLQVHLSALARFGRK